MANKIRSEESKLTPQQAFAKALETRDGRELYESDKIERLQFAGARQRAS
jgi:hypothetical protein